MDFKSDNRKNKPPKIEEMTKEQIRETIMKKRESTARAQRIVESLLEPGTSEEKLLRCLPHLNQRHLDDVVEERAITLVCGYPPCTHRLSEKDIPKQQYRISMRTNKVYDITERKNFCSNWCYKATLYIKKQMLTSPLWYREQEIIPAFILMPSDELPIMGQAVDLSLVEKIKVRKDPAHFTSIHEFTGASLIDLDGYENSTEGNEKAMKYQKQTDKEIPSDHEPTPVNIKNSESTSIIENIVENPGNLVQEIQPMNINEEQILKCENEPHMTDGIGKSRVVNPENEILLSSKPEQKRTRKTQKPLTIIGEVIEHPEKKIDPILTSNVMKGTTKYVKSTQKKISSSSNEDKIVSAVIYVEKCVAEWFTLDSMILLLGEIRVKEMVTDKGDCIKEYLNNMANGLFYSSTSYDQYQQLCRKLNMLELEDHRYDSSVFNRETKPLPDYSIIKEEGKRMELKVRAFLSGEVEVSEPNPIQKTHILNEDASKLTQLAPVDKKAQNSLRRKILLTNLNKVLDDLQRSIGLQGFSIASDVRLLVNSFKLNANNIMFKPIQWTLIGMIIIKLLSLRDSNLGQALQSPIADRHLQMLLLSYKQDGGYLNRLLLWLTDIDRLLDTSHTQLTVQI